MSLPLWCLNPYRNLVFSKMGGKEPAFVTLFLPKYVSDQAADLLSPILERFMPVFKGGHKFNRINRNGKGRAKISQRSSQGKLFSMITSQEVSILE